MRVKMDLHSEIWLVSSLGSELLAILSDRDPLLLDVAPHFHDCNSCANGLQDIDNENNSIGSRT